jgi:hypothetical protein
LKSALLLAHIFRKKLKIVDFPEKILVHYGRYKKLYFYRQYPTLGISIKAGTRRYVAAPNE